jgi:hypothetical protein
MSRPNPLTEEQLQHVVEICEDTITLYLNEVLQAVIPGNRSLLQNAATVANVVALRDTALSRMESTEKGESMAEKMARVRLARKAK